VSFCCIFFYFFRF